jgi:hypothetical protein
LGAAARRPKARVSQVGLSAYCGDDRFALLSELRLAGRSPIKQRKTEVALQCVDCIADGGRDARMSFWLGSEGSVFGYRHEHQKLMDTRHRRTQHFEILEKYCQFYTDFR